MGRIHKTGFEKIDAGIQMKIYNQKTPRIPIIILKLMTPEFDLEPYLMDLRKSYNDLLHEKGKAAAYFWIWTQIIRSLPGLFSAGMYRNGMMFRNHFKIFLRNFRKRKAYYFINISGLTVGMASCMLIFMFIRDETGYDKYHKNAANIYRVTLSERVNGTNYQYAGVPFGAIKAFEDQIPEIIAVARMMFGEGVATVDDRAFEVEGILYTDPEFLEIFSYEFIQGNRKSALNEPGSAVITESVALMFFGEKDPVGKVITLDSDGDIVVKGVIKDVPHNSHFSFNIVLNNTGFRQRREGVFKSWKGIAGWAYILVEDGTDPFKLNQKFKMIENTYFERDDDARVASRITTSGRGDEQLMTGFIVQKLTDIHLRSNLQFEIRANSDIYNIYIFSFTAMLILLIACFNFINLSTAKSIERGREVGLRKVFGAYRRTIAGQFLGESLFLSFTGMLIGLILVVSFLPVFNSLTGKGFNIWDLLNIDFITALLVFVLITGIIAGSYPAFFLSSFKPDSALKGSSRKLPGGTGFRKYLVLSQFIISIFLIVSTLIVSDQLEYMRNIRLGFDKEHILIVRMKSSEVKTKYSAFREELLKNRNIISASYSSDIPGRSIDVVMFTAEGRNQEELYSLYYFSTDHDFVKTYGIEIKHGRDFSKKYGSDNGSYLINETGADLLGWDEGSLDKKIFMKGRWEGRISGIIKDFKFRTVKETVKPFVICLTPEIGRHRGYLSLKVNGSDLPETIEYVKSIWEDFDNNREIEFFFIDDFLDSLYKSEEKFNKIISVFTAIAIFIACLGLFGLISYTAEQRSREIGIRKTMGATIPGIVIMITKEFSTLVLAANIIALPLASFIMKRYWLQDFAHRIEPGIFMFILSGVIAMIIAFLTVSYQSLKAARTDPVKALRHE